MLPTVSLMPRCAGITGNRALDQGDVGGADGEPADGGEITLREGRVVAHRLQERRPAEHVRRALRLDEVERGPGLEPLDAQHRRARLERATEDECAADPEEGERGEVPVGPAARTPATWRARRVARTTVPCVCITPLGSALEPDV